MSTRLAVCALTDVGLVRENNEDAFLVADLPSGAFAPSADVTRFEVTDHGALIALSDGMGGHKGGAEASRLTLNALFNALASSPPSAETSERLRVAVEGANLAVFNAGEGTGSQRMGATLTAVLIQGHEAFLAEIGDSRAYLLRNGVIEQVTHDQSMRQALLDSGAVSPEDAAEGPFRNIVLQAIGQKPAVTVALGKLELRARDCIILCSDGLSNELTKEEIGKVILGAPSLNEACAELVELAKRRGGHDNITVVVAGVGGDVPPLVPGERISSTLDILSTFDGKPPSRRPPAP
jgi:serine/threonine protein phosphatase PrpC